MSEFDEVRKKTHWARDENGTLVPVPKSGEECDSCGSDRVIKFSAKCSDLCWTQYKGEEYDGYVPRIDADIDEYGDYLCPAICLECGKVQGKFPKPDPDFDGV